MGEGGGGILAIHNFVFSRRYIGFKQGRRPLAKAPPPPLYLGYGLSLLRFSRDVFFRSIYVEEQEPIAMSECWMVWLYSRMAIL